MRAAGSAGALRLWAGGRLNAQGALVFAYHNITDDDKTDYCVSPSLLHDQLRWAQSWGVHFVPLDDLVDATLAGRSVDGWGSVVFDDALMGVYRNAAVLDALSIPATVFAVSDRLGQVPGWWAGSERLMTIVELRELADAGISIGAHSRNHASLIDLDDAELTDEVAGSRDELEQLLQRQVDLFAYPFGHFDPRVRHAALTAEYRAAFTFLNGRIHPGLDRYRLPRLNMWHGQHRGRLAYHLARSAPSWGDTQVEAMGPSGLRAPRSCRGE